MDEFCLFSKTFFSQLKWHYHYAHIYFFNGNKPEMCVTSFPGIGDQLDNDCDGFTDEDTCTLRYGVTGTGKQRPE